jgi:cytochrome c-type biogenesis protein CcmH
MTLWIILIVLSAVAAAWLTIPLVRRHEARVDARAATIAVLKDQLADIDVQLAAGAIQPPEAEGMRNEIRRRLLAAGHIPAELDRTMGQKALSGVALGLAAMVAVAAAALYASMGRPDLATGPGTASQAAAPAPAQEQAAAGEVAQLISGLEQKMQSTPDDPEGWRMLGWSYFQTGRYADAVKAYGRAIALKPDGEGYQSAYGEALVQEAGGQVTPAAAAAFEKAAAQDGADARARYFLAVRKAEQGDRKGAIEDMLKLVADSPADAPWLPQLRQAILQTAQAAGIDINARLEATKPVGNASVPGGVPAPVAAAAAAGAVGPPAPGGAGVMPSPSRDQVQAAQAMTPADRQAMIRGMVDGLAEKLKANPKDEAGWLRLMRARQVLGDAAAAKAARDQALAAFAGDAAAQGRIRAAAAEMGL